MVQAWLPPLPRRKLCLSQQGMQTKEWLRSAGFTFVKVEGDGNCFFHSLGHYIKKDHDLVRKELCMALSPHSWLLAFGTDEQRARSWPQHLEHVRQAGTWASSIEIAAAAFLGGHDIAIIANDVNYIFTTRPVPAEKTPLISLHWHDRNHFTPILNGKGKRFTLEQLRAALHYEVKVVLVQRPSFPTIAGGGKSTAPLYIIFQSTASSIGVASLDPYNTIICALFPSLFGRCIA